MTALVTLWEGQGIINVKDTVFAPLGRFVSAGVQTGDTVILKDVADPAVVETTEVIQVDGEDRLFVKPNPLTATSYQMADGTTVTTGTRELMVQVVRPVAKPCPVCKADGVVAESDHLHCPRCKAHKPVDEKGLPADGRTHCIDCVQRAREMLAKSNHFQETVPMFGGKLPVTVHARTVQECDFMQEWQDRLIIETPQATTQWVLDESSRAALALGLDDDGKGNCPRNMVAGTTDDPSVRIPLICRMFKDYNAGVYRAMLAALDRLDSLVEDACVYRIEEEPTEEELLVLADALATSEGEVRGTVSIWDGLEVITFAAPSQSELDEANSFAEAIIQANKGKILDGRARFLITLARLAANFRGDSKQHFDEEATFDERLNYLFTLPMPMYYLYIHAGNAFNKRVARASELDVLGNF